MATKQNPESGLTRPQTPSELKSDAAAAAGAKPADQTSNQPAANQPNVDPNAPAAAPAQPDPYAPGASSNADPEQGTVDTSGKADPANPPTVADNTPNGRKAAKDVNIGDNVTVTNLLDAPLKDFETGEIYEFNVPTKATLTSFLEGQRAAGRLRVEK